MSSELGGEPLAVAPEGILLEDLTSETARGPVYFRRRVPAERLAEMRMAEGLGIFFRYDLERQKETLLKIARMPYGAVAIAHTPDDLITGYVTVHPIDPTERWQAVNEVSPVNRDGRLYVVEFGAIEVSRQWRGCGISPRLMRAGFEGDAWFDDKIVVSVEFAWHWDYEEAGLTKFNYRNMLRKVISTGGFEKMDTDEANIIMDSANMFMVRIGQNTPMDVQQRFFALLHKDNRWGF